MRLFSSDRLSPILVKELRQGIRSKLFLGAFLIIQLLLFLYGTTLVMSNSFNGDSSAELALFWAAIVLPMLILIPAMASQGIEKEISGRTLDLLLLTRLSSYRLVLGKWVSVLVQSSLLVTSALPYVMLRYFLGGIDIWTELKSLGILVLASALLAGITMGFWATKVSKVVKWLGVLAFLWVGPYTFIILLVSRRGLGSSIGTGFELWVYAFIAMLMMLALAASRIGPPAENHSTQLRVLALVAVAVGLIVNGVHDVEVISAMLALTILVPTVIGALSEAVRPVPRLYAPFMRRSGISRWLAFPLSPGWPGGVAFTCVVLALTPLFPVWRGEFRAEVFVAVATTFLFPAALVRTLLRPDRRTLGLYLLTVVVLTIPIYVWGAARAFENTGVVFTIDCIVGLFPPVALALELSEPSGYAGAAAALEGILVLIWSLIVLVRAARAEWSAMARFLTPPAAPVPRAPLPSVAPTVEGTTP